MLLSSQLQSPNQVDIRVSDILNLISSKTSLSPYTPIFTHIHTLHTHAHLLCLSSLFPTTTTTTTTTKQRLKYNFYLCFVIHTHPYTHTYQRISIYLSLNVCPTPYPFFSTYLSLIIQNSHHRVIYACKFVCLPVCIRARVCVCVCVCVCIHTS